MRQFLGAVAAVTLLSGLGGTLAADNDATSKAILDKAIKALGGQEKLGQVKAILWKTKGKIHLGEDDNPFTSRTVARGLAQFRTEFEGQFMGNAVKAVIILSGDKGWRKFGDQTMELDADGLANEKRTAYLRAAATLVLPLRGKGFKVASAGAGKVDDRPAAILKITPADGKEFTIWFDKENGLPVRQVAKVVGFMGEEFTQEATFAGYKDFDGMKVATQIVVKRDGQPFLQQEITEFKTLNKIDPKTFAAPD